MGYLRENMDCPLCKSVLVERVNGKTKKPFLGCPNFPSCRGHEGTKVYRTNKLIQMLDIRDCLDYGGDYVLIGFNEDGQLIPYIKG